MGSPSPVAEINKTPQNIIQHGQRVPSHVDTYSLHVLPGVNAVVMLAVLVILDQPLFSLHDVHPDGIYSRYGHHGRGLGGDKYTYLGGCPARRRVHWPHVAAAMLAIPLEWAGLISCSLSRLGTFVGCCLALGAWFLRHADRYGEGKGQK